MVAKISIGSSLYGALAYNGEKINEEHGRVLGANKIVLPADGNMNIGAMTENFKAFMPKMGRTKKPVLHISLNPHPDDRLTDQDFEILAREYLDKLGFGEQPYIMYKHEDIDRHHIHIVTVNVNEQGKRLDQSFLFRRSKKITNELEEKYGLHKAQREKVSPDTPITKIDPNGDIKRQIQNTVKLVGMRWQFQSIGEYNAILGLYNVKCELTDGKVNGREYHGLVYFATDDNGTTIATPLKASRLGKFASRTAIENKFERDKEKIDIKPTRRLVSEAMAASAGKDDFIARVSTLFYGITMTADCMGQHTLTITIMFRSTDPVSAKSFLQIPFTSGSTTRRQNPRFSLNRVSPRDSRYLLPMAVSSLSPMADHNKIRVRLRTNRLSNLSQANSAKLHQILTTSISTRYCRDSDFFRQDRTSTLRKKPSPVVRVRRKRRKDADCKSHSPS